MEDIAFVRKCDGSYQYVCRSIIIIIIIIIILQNNGPIPRDTFMDIPSRIHIVGTTLIVIPVQYDGHYYIGRIDRNESFDEKTIEGYIEHE